MKIYNKILLQLVAILFICSLSACDENINLKPEGILSSDIYFDNPADYDKALNALYVRLNAGTYNQWIDATADDALVTHSWNRGFDLGRGTATAFSSFPNDKWTQNYISVQRANNIVANIDKYAWSGGENNQERNKILSEARSLRAYFYLDLVCLFGRIQFYEKNPATVEESKSIAQVENPKMVFDFILKELEESIPTLPETIGASNKSKLGKPAARLLRARAAAYAAGYLNDKSYFDITLFETEKLLSASHTLGDYEKLFTYGNLDLSEVILSKQYSADAKNSWGNWYNNSIGGYCVTSPIKALVDAYEYIKPINPSLPYLNKDSRFYASIYAPGAIIRGKYYNTIPHNTIVKDGKTYFDPAKDYGEFQDKEVLHGDVLGESGGGEWNKTPTGFTYKKYNAEGETWNTFNAFIIFRFAEAYLLRAEAIVERGGSEAEAKSLIKIIRDRSGNSNSIDDMIANKYGSLLNLIRNERRVEMAQEGLRLFDIRRWKLFLDVMNEPAQGIEYRDFDGTPSNKIYNVVPLRSFAAKDYWWPIPQSEIDLNKGRISQNEEWEN